MGVNTDDITVTRQFAISMQRRKMTLSHGRAVEMSMENGF